MGMRNVAIAGLLTSMALAACEPAAQSQAPALVLEQTIDLPNVKGRIDHLAFDPQHKRLFVAELENGTIEAVDLAQGRTAGRISGLGEPQGLAYLTANDELAAAAGDGVVRFYAGADLKPVGEIKLGSDADNVRVDPANGDVVVGYGSGALAVIDPAAKKVIRTIALPAHPESFRIDAEHRLAFVNLPGASKIGVVNLDAETLTATRPAAHMANYPLLLDAASGLLAAVYRLPARLVLTDADSGAVRQDLSTCGDSDDLFLDAKRHRIYVSCGSGDLDIFEASAAGYVPTGHIKTRSGARTSLFVPELDRLYVAARANGGKPAAILVYRPAP